MSKLIGKIPQQGEKSLEMIMRDSMDGLQDSALYFAYQSMPETLEILSIEPPKPVDFKRESAHSNKAEVVKITPPQDISEYLIQRELYFERLSV